MVAYNNKKYYVDIIETKPSHAISIIETDCEVDFAPPLDYKEPENVAVGRCYLRKAAAASPRLAAAVAASPRLAAAVAASPGVTLVIWCDLYLTVTCIFFWTSCNITTFF